MAALSPGAWHRAMLAGDYESAWRIGDRFLGLPQSPDVPRHLSRTWDGTSPDDRRVLLRSYHGLGDAVQFLRYAPLLRQRAQSVDLWVQRELISLLKGAPGIDALRPLTAEAPPEGYDLHIEVMELPHLFRTTLGTIPPPLPLFDRWRPHVHAGPFRIGLVWRAGDWEASRSIPTKELAPLGELPVEWRIFQRGRAREEIPEGFGTLAGSPDLRATAEEMLGLDLLVTVDSLPAHLAGTLGVPTWLLLRHDGDWRWLEDREDSPWYPSIRIFRQAQEGDWSGVLQELSGEIRRLIRERKM